MWSKRVHSSLLPKTRQFGLFEDKIAATSVCGCRSVYKDFPVYPGTYQVWVKRTSADTDRDQIYCVLREPAHLCPSVRASLLELRQLNLGEVSESLNPGLPCQQWEQCSLLGLRGQLITMMMMAGHREVAATYIFPFCWRFKWLRHKQVLLSLRPLV